ncbi:hypothetical protein G6F57_022778 [Rhizopus arrhizus]|nr:hypothetical protein G6F57_022778 [Rhizopus arrhizus]
MSILPAQPTGLPVSPISACRKSSKRRVMPSASASRWSVRASTDKPAQAGSARCAAAMARLTWSWLASWTWAICCPSTGLCLSKVDAPSSKRPSM